MNIKRLYTETHYGLLFFSVKPLSPRPTHEKASCEKLYMLDLMTILVNKTWLWENNRSNLITKKRKD